MDKRKCKAQGCSNIVATPRSHYCAKHRLDKAIRRVVRTK